MENAPYDALVANGPENANAYWVNADDGVRLRVTEWREGGSSKGTVLIFQGRTENIEKYGRTVLALQDFGYCSFAIDWRGQGLSDRLTDDRMTGHVGAYSDYQRDVAAMMLAAATLDLPKPWFLLGHSLGACVGLRALIEGLPVEACAFTAPLWGLNISPLQRLAAWPLSWAAMATGKGHAYAPGTRGESYVLHTPFDENRLTQDRDMYQYYVDISEKLEEQQLGGPSMRWLFQTLKETRSLSKQRSPDLPCLTFCGADDTIVATHAAVNRMSRWPRGELEIIAGAKHDVLCETPKIRSKVLERIDLLFEQSLAGAVR